MQRYEKINLLGSGNFGKAWLAKSLQSQRHYVIKEIRMTAELSSKDRDRIFNEVNIIKSCCHLNIIRYKEFFITNEPSSKTHCRDHSKDEEAQLSNPSTMVPIISIVMEYANAGDLHECIRRHRDVTKTHLPEDIVRNWLVQISFALEYLHKNCILHRDLKTQNIFMTSNRLLKIGDFGISKALSRDQDFATTGIGTPQYLSPEIIKQQKYDYKTDIWGLGCVIYEICSLNPAFSGSDLGALFQNIARASYKPLPQRYSQSLAELVKVMLRPDPHRRPTVAQILAAKVLKDDVQRYMEFTRTLPDPNSSFKNSNSSPCSSEGYGSGHLFDAGQRKSSSCSVHSVDGKLNEGSGSARKTR